jgi:N-methylhydantoinase A
MRYLGQFHEIAIELEDRELDDAGRAAVEFGFHQRYEELYGYSLPWRTVEILECHLRGSVPQEAAAPQRADRAEEPRPLAEALDGERNCRIAGARRQVPAYRRELLEDGHSFPGPALVDSPASTVFVPEAFQARVDAVGDLVLTQVAPERARELAEAGERAA